MANERRLLPPRDRHYSNHHGVDDLANYFARRYVETEEQNELLRREVSRLRRRTYELQQLTDRRGYRIQELVASIRQLILLHHSVGFGERSSAQDSRLTLNARLGSFADDQGQSSHSDSSSNSSVHFECWSDVGETADSQPQAHDHEEEPASGSSMSVVNHSDNSAEDVRSEHE